MILSGVKNLDVSQIKKKYRRNARFYDILERPTHRLREKAVQQLALKPGDAVLDFGCGTGLSFELLEQVIGPQGHIVGVELSPEMIAKAQEKMAQHGWRNVSLIEANADEVELQPESVDAVLCFCTHDIMKSRRALERAVKALRTGGCLVAAGVKRAHGLHGAVLNLITHLYSQPFVANLSGTERPWSHLQSLLGQINIEEHMWGSSYIAHGMKKASPKVPDT